ncbi:AI-2E family transporter [Rhodohalobacter sp. SW132]|uniref:AI-2E family transporter n=1 Tax=Rhodohalobacter sp. SW132 TaxID=2293433 RepID=UPI000E247F8A|nr:AI-2E family transporter [Rhodohalobacter sp. SW132]REL37642.1 AI-2E family transporter [Rhodohalobacter sp. SW132]
MNSSLIAKYTYILAAVILTIYAMIEANSLLQPLLFALFFSILLSPFCSWMESHKVPRLLSVSIAIITGVLAVAGIGFFFYTQLTAFAGDVDIFRERLAEILEASQDLLYRWFGIEALIDIELVRESTQEFFRENTAVLTRGIAGAASVFTSIFLVPVFMFFLLLFRDFLEEFILKVFGQNSQKDFEKVKSIIGKVKKVVQGYLTGIILVILILSVLNSVMLLVIGVDHAIFFGVFAAMLNVIPFVGPLLGSILPILYALFTMDSLVIPLIIMLGFYIIQLMESNIFTPIIVGSKVSINAFAALLLLFIGAQIWGIIGMILMIPIGAILKVVFDEIDSMKPYGFVMGRVPTDYKRRKSLFAEKMSAFSDKVSKDLEEKREVRKKEKNDSDENE